MTAQVVEAPASRLAAARAPSKLHSSFDVFKIKTSGN
jgi:hypothetical protein